MQAALRAGRQGIKAVSQSGSARAMSSGHSIEEEVKEMSKWRMVTYAAIPACIVFAIYTLRNEHPHEHHDDAPHYSYMRIRSKSFPWGDCGLFEHCEPAEEAEE